jgi:hypothetical protein
MQVELYLAPLFALATMWELQAAFCSGMAMKKEAEIIPFPKRRRRGSRNRQFWRDTVNAAIDRT